MTSTALSGSLVVAAQPLFSDSSVQLHNLGETISSNDGRRFRYAKAGASNLVAGKLQQSKVETTANENLAVAAAAIGDFAIVTTSTITATANQYAGGLAVITVTPGQGYAYQIKSNPAVTAAVITISLVDAIQVALTTSSKLDLVENPFSSVIINPATATAAPAGVAVYPITALYYGWLQTGGQCSVLADGAVTVGTTVVASNGVAGAIEPFAGVQAVVGIAMTGIADTEYGTVKLMLN
jgi:hypothetical protein